MKQPNFRKAEYYWIIKKITDTHDVRELRFYARNLPMTINCINDGSYTTPTNYINIAVLIAADVYIEDGSFEKYKADFDIARKMLEHSHFIKPNKISSFLCEIHNNVRKYLQQLEIEVKIPHKTL